MFGQLDPSCPPFHVDVSNSRSARHDAARVRHRVYCIERGYEAGVGGIETDVYDVVSRHVVLRDAAGDPVGTTRLVRHSYLGYPMERVCPGIIDTLGLDRAATAELSRFSLVRGAEAAVAAPRGAMRLALMRGIVALCREGAHATWCALMEPGLLRLLRASSIHFTPVGPLVEHRGLRQSCHAEVAGVLEHIRREKEPLWRYLTGATQTQALAVGGTSRPTAAACMARRSSTAPASSVFPNGSTGGGNLGIAGSAHSA